MNKQELISIIRTEILLAKSLPERKGYIAGLEMAINIIEGFSNEPQKPVVPQFVADYIEFKKKNNFHVYGAMRVIEDHYDKRVPDWFYEGNIETFVRAWLDGYEVEKEKRYTVKIKAVNQYLVRNPDEEFLGFLQSRLKSKFTRKELENAGFGEVFNCPLFEVEEVE